MTRFDDSRARQTAERTYGTPQFIARTRLPDTLGPPRFEPTRKQSGDVVI